MLEEFERMKGAFADAPSNGVLTPSDLAHIPICVQRYLQRTNAVGAPLTSTFADQGKAVYERQQAGATVLYRSKDVRHSIMKIKLAGLITVADGSGPIMNKSETVTFFNEEGDLVNFISDDRSMSADGKTPIRVLS